MLGLKVSRVHTAVARRELPFIRIGRLLRFSAEAISIWVESKQATKNINNKEEGRGHGKLKQ
jgi:excisionase family DNA binding protein